MRQDQRALGDLLGEEPVGVAAPVPALVVVADPAGLAGRQHRLDDVGAQGGVRLHHLVVVRRQPSRRHQDRLGDARLADVVDPSRLAQVLGAAARPAELAGEAWPPGRRRAPSGPRWSARGRRWCGPPAAGSRCRASARGCARGCRWTSGGTSRSSPLMTAGGPRTSDLSRKFLFRGLVRHSSATRRRRPRTPPLTRSMTAPRTRSRCGSALRVAQRAHRLADARLHVGVRRVRAAAGVLRHQHLPRPEARVWESPSERITSSVTTPPALRMTWASPAARPRTASGSIRASMHVTTAMASAGGGGSSVGGTSARARTASTAWPSAVTWRGAPPGPGPRSR